MTSPNAAIEQALASNDLVRAAALAETALAAGRTDPLLLNLAAWGREEAGDYAGAHQLLQRALAIAPGDVMILGAIGAVLRKEDRLQEALVLLDRVVSSAPRHASAWLERGYVLDGLRRERDAAQSYERALEADPNLAPALGRLAAGAARRGDREDAARLAQRALALDPAEPHAVFALAMPAIEARDGITAEAPLRPLLTGALAGHDRTHALTLLGNALDRQDRTSEVFVAWQDAQANFRDVWASSWSPRPDRPSHRAFLTRIAEQVAAMADTPNPYPGPVPSAAAAGHVFLLGYPRSGTTLVETVLASAPNVVALEEQDTLIDADEALLAPDGTMPALDRLDPALIRQLRDKYWSRVTTLAGRSVTGLTVIDMHPLNGFNLPLLARLFPDARIVIMRRDPRDVVLSCFRIDFTPGPVAWAFSDLEETALHYAAMMGLIQLCRKRLPLACHELRYEQLVTDFAGTVRALADFIGIGWTDDFLRFDRTARTRGVTTASATQVRRGLYDGRAQWHRYATELAPVMPILSPWLERFGYPG